MKARLDGKPAGGPDPAPVMARRAAGVERIILGIDPGLRNTGWGVIEAAGTRLTYVGCGSIHTDAGDSLAERLALIHRSIARLIDDERPAEAAVEETFVNRDPQSTLKLGQARGAALAVLALRELPVAEYAANLIKKTVVGVGHAEKAQVQMMVKMLLPASQAKSPDAADALAARAALGLDDAPLVRIEKDLQGSPTTKTYALIRDEMGTVMGVAEEQGSGTPHLLARYLYAPYGQRHTELGPELEALEARLQGLQAHQAVVGDIERHHRAVAPLLARVGPGIPVLLQGVVLLHRGHGRPASAQVRDDDVGAPSLG